MRFFNGLRSRLRFIEKTYVKVHELGKRMDRLQLAVGRLERRLDAEAGSSALGDHEFQVYSQWSEDGIIQHLVRRIVVPHPVFVEFGVQNYTESNTRFLLQNDNWSGLVIDSSTEHIRAIKSDPIFWKHNLKAECAFVTRDNIDAILRRNGLSGDIGLLSIDIDGNDYWVWQAIRCAEPRIVICEYNSLFGKKRKAVIPYQESFDRTRAHHSNLYFGASIAALEALGREKGYCLVGSNRAGNNLFFVRRDLAGGFRALSADEAYVKAQFRESRDAQGNLTYLDFGERLAEIGDRELLDLDTGRLIRVRETAEP